MRRACRAEVGIDHIDKVEAEQEAMLRQENDSSLGEGLPTSAAQPGREVSAETPASRL